MPAQQPLRCQNCRARLPSTATRCHYCGGEKLARNDPNQPVASSPTIGQRARTPGWYPDPDDPDSLRWWNGTNFDGEPRTPENLTVHESPNIERAAPVDILDAAITRPGGRLFIVYALGVLIPLFGFVAAIYIAVAQRCAPLRRHALGIGATALLASAGYLVVFLPGASRPDAQVATDLTNLLMNNGTSLVFATHVRCAHQGGNQYICTYDANGPHTVLVTDDGSTISEVPYY